MGWRSALSRRGDDAPDFAGKIAVISCASGNGGGVFEQVRLVRIGFSHFIVGRKIEMDAWRDRPAAPVTAWFGINEISQMYLYEDLEDAREAHFPESF